MPIIFIWLMLSFLLFMDSVIYWFKISFIVDLILSSFLDIYLEETYNHSTWLSAFVREYNLTSWIIRNGALRHYRWEKINQHGSATLSRFNFMHLPNQINSSSSGFGGCDGSSYSCVGPYLWWVGMLALLISSNVTHLSK